MKSLLVFNGRDIKVILSLQATDLLSKMLTFQPSLRITASEALSHPYFADFGVSPHDLSSSSSANTTRYQRTTTSLLSSSSYLTTARMTMIMIRSQISDMSDSSLNLSQSSSGASTSSSAMDKSL